MFQKQSRPLILLDFTSHQLRFVFKRFNAASHVLRVNYYVVTFSLSLSLSLVSLHDVATVPTILKKSCAITQRMARNFRQIYVNHCRFPGSVGNINYTSDRASSVRLNAGSAWLLNIRWPARNAISSGKKKLCSRVMAMLRYIVTSYDSSTCMSI